MNIFVFVNMGPYLSENFKTLLLPQITFKYFHTFSEIFSQWSSQKYCFEFLKFEFPIFNQFPNWVSEFHHCTLWGNQTSNYLENERL